MKIAPTCAFSVVVGCLLAQSHGVFGSPSLRNRKDERKLDGYHDPYGHPQGPYGHGYGYPPPLPPPLPYGGKGVEGQFYYYTNPLLPPLPGGTVEPSPRPTERPSPRPTYLPTPHPTSAPSPRPSPGPTPRPTERPTPVPTSAKPTKNPTRFPTEGPSKKPTPSPTRSPTVSPTESTESPTTSSPSESMEPSEVPTFSEEPTESPSESSEPSENPTSSEEPSESVEPSDSPSDSLEPSQSPSLPVPMTVARTICDPDNSPETQDFCRLAIVTGLAFILNDFEDLEDRFIPDPLVTDFIRDLGLAPAPPVSIARRLDTNNRALLSGTGNNDRNLESTVVRPSFDDFVAFFSINYPDFFDSNPLRAGDNFDEFIGIVRSKLEERLITVFVPTNQALAAVNSDIAAAVPAADDPIAVAYDILLSHSVAGASVLFDALECDTPVAMANGENTFTLCSGFDRFQVGINNNEFDEKCVIDASITCRGNYPKIIRENSDIEATNGVVHSIDNVILPAVASLTPQPSAFPSASPAPSSSPTKNPTPAPSISPMPTRSPTENPTKQPTKEPTKSPTRAPTKSPTKGPTKNPTRSPTREPTQTPTKAAKAFFISAGIP